MKKKSLTKNYIYNSIYQVFAIIVPLITTPYIARVLLPNNVGINSYVNSIVTLFTTIGLLGLSNYSVREIAYVRNNQKKLNKTFFELFFLRIIFMVLTLIIYMVYSGYNNYYIYFMIYIPTLIGTFLDISWLFQGMEELKLIVIRSFIIKILSTISIFVFVRDINDLKVLMIIYSLTTVFSTISLYPITRKYITKFEIKNLELKKHIIPNLKLFLPQVATLVYCQFDKIMIEALTNNVSEVGFYNQAEKIVKIPLTLITSLSTVLLPRISECFINKKMDNVKKYVSNSFRFSLLLSIPLTLGIVAISSNFVIWFLGVEYSSVSSILTLLSITVIFISLSSVSGSQYLTATNQTKILTISYITSAIIDIIINYLLIGKYGANGAAIGTIVAEALVFIIQFNAMKNIIKFKELIIFSKNYVFSGIIMFVICYLLQFIISSSLILTFTQIIVGIGIYFLFLLILKDEMFKHYLNRVLTKIKK